MKKVMYITFLLLSAFHIASASEEHATSTPPIEQEEQRAGVTMHLRYQDQLVFEGKVNLRFDTTKIPIDETQSKEIASNSVLATFMRLDEEHEEFSISDLGYFASFDAFLLNCITLIAAETEACFNWQYVVNGSFPFLGMDNYLLEEEDDVYIFFGTSHRVVPPGSPVKAGKAFIVGAQNYLYQSNEWEPLKGVTIGVFQPDEQDPFSQIIFATSTADTNGKGEFIIDRPGQYQVGIKEDFFFPSQPLEVIHNTQEEGQSETTPPANQAAAAGGGGGGEPLVQKFNREQALAYLKAHQKEDGSIAESLFINDWIAIAFASQNVSDETAERLKEYIKASEIQEGVLTDYLRHAMALMALKINPYEGTNVNYIDRIVSGFDGEQFGDEALVNDDIFALVALFSAGYTSTDEEIVAAVEFILKKQEANGAWIGIDITAAAIQALAPFAELPGVARAMEKAEAYIKSQLEDNGSVGGNVFSTSWAMQAIGALNQSESSWESNAGKRPSGYLAEVQAEDGGLLDKDEDSTSRLWATAYALPASSLTPWSVILHTFEKIFGEQKSTPVGGGGGGGGGIQADEERVFFTFDEEKIIEVRKASSTPTIRTPKILIPANTRTNIKESEWDGMITITLATSTDSVYEEHKETFGKETSLKVLIEVKTTAPTLIEFEKAVTIVIPVEGVKDGTLLEVYTRQERDHAFTFLTSCQVGEGQCAFEAYHFSEFALVGSFSEEERIAIPQYQGIEEKEPIPTNSSREIQIAKQPVMRAISSKTLPKQESGQNEIETQIARTTSQESAGAQTALATQGRPSSSTRYIFFILGIITIGYGSYILWKRYSS